MSVNMPIKTAHCHQCWLALEQEFKVPTCQLRKCYILSYESSYLKRDRRSVIHRGFQICKSPKEQSTCRDKRRDRYAYAEDAFIRVSQWW
jgi:hypothetical protein